MGHIWGSDIPNGVSFNGALLIYPLSYEPIESFQVCRCLLGRCPWPYLSLSLIVGSVNRITVTERIKAPSLV